MSFFAARVDYRMLEDNDVHQEILAAMENKVEDGVENRHAIKRAMAKCQHEFEGLFQYEPIEEDSNASGSEEEMATPQLPALRGGARPLYWALSEGEKRLNHYNIWNEQFLSFLQLKEIKILIEN